MAAPSSSKPSPRFHLGCPDCDLLSDVSALKDRPASVGEEIANSASHGVGFLALLGAVPFLISHVSRYGHAASIVGVSIFSATLLLVYLTSTLYHALPRGRGKHILRRVEHAVIYLLIAGTYTPFTLGVLRGPWGWTLFGIIWALALLGILLKTLRGTEYPILAMLLYLSMGWVALIAIRPLWLRIPHRGLLWILAGGVAYTAGAVFYSLKRRYTHFIWHLFVMAGSTLHYFAVLWYAD
jgi:hemolysin III